jgi:hypothetical protein
MNRFLALLFLCLLNACTRQLPFPPAAPMPTAVPTATPNPYTAYPVTDRPTTDSSLLRYAPSYKLSPDSSDLTAADVIGPDGIVYPDFSRAGLLYEPRADLPVFPVEDFGAIADDESDDAAALQAAINAAATADGGIVLLGPGTYHVKSPLRIAADHILLRGAGKDLTTFHFDYTLAREEVRIVFPVAGQTLTRNDHIEVHSHPRRLEHHILYVNDKEMFRRGADTSGGERFSLIYPANNLRASEKGTVTIKAVVERFDGTRTETIRTVPFDPAPARPGTQQFSHSVGAIQFLGDDFTGKHRSTPVTLTAPTLRGDTTLSVSDSSEFQPEDFILLHAPATEAFLTKTASARKDFHPRVILQVKSIEGNTLHLDRPLRMDFPGTPTVRTIYPIIGGGVEGLTFVQARKQWIDAILADVVVNLRFKDLRIAKPGRNPVALGNALHCEIRDSEFGRPWFSGGGGTGYLGFQSAWESLVDNIDANELRHAPAIQGWSSGNVFRNSRLVKSDANYHMLWAHENLVEQCTIDAARGSGSYGYAFFAQVPEMKIHGPGGGPRNVIYNNTTVSPRPAVYLGGSNENWIIVHNRFTVEEGPGLLIKNHSFDHIIWNNVIEIQDGSSPALLLETADTPGIELVGNHIAGTDTMVAGEAEPMINRVNRFADTDGSVKFPPSLYQWQLQVNHK